MKSNSEKIAALEARKKSYEEKDPDLQRAHYRMHAEN